MHDSLLIGETEKLFSQTRTALEQFDNQHDFERMAADILNAQGYKDVVPVAPRGGSDEGKDITFTTESGGKGLACITLRKDIEVKFKQDFSQRTVGEYEKYVLFCTKYLKTSQKLQFTKFCLETLQALFVPYDIEALRSLLDSSLKSIRETYLHIKDDSKGVSEEALVTLREEMQKFSEAQMLVFEADKTSDAIRADHLVKKAVELQPAFRQREYRKLGIRMAQAVINNRLSLPMASDFLLLDEPPVPIEMKKEAIALYARSAITYLSETVLQETPPDAEGLLYLACMYGYQLQFYEMIKVINQAVNTDDKTVEEIQEQFQQPPITKMLLRACGSDRTFIEKLGKKIGLPPVSKESFCDYIKKFDYIGFHGYIKWLAVKRSSAAGEKGMFLLNIVPPYSTRQGLVSASAQQIDTGRTDDLIPFDTPVTIEELYERLYQVFILICPTAF